MTVPPRHARACANVCACARVCGFARRYSLLLMCWSDLPAERPAFDVLEALLKNTPFASGGAPSPEKLLVPKMSKRLSTTSSHYEYSSMPGMGTQPQRPRGSTMSSHYEYAANTPHTGDGAGYGASRCLSAAVSTTSHYEYAHAMQSAATVQRRSASPGSTMSFPDAHGMSCNSSPTLSLQSKRGNQRSDENMNTYVADASGWAGATPATPITARLGAAERNLKRAAEFRRQQDKTSTKPRNKAKAGAPHAHGARGARGAQGGASLGSSANGEDAWKVNPLFVRSGCETHGQGRSGHGDDGYINVRSEQTSPASDFQEHDASRRSSGAFGFANSDTSFDGGTAPLPLTI